MFTDLGTLTGDNFAEGGSINDTGQIVGQSCSATSCSVFLWENGVMTDLNAIIPAGSSLNPIAAHGINSRGEIVGWGFQNATGLMHAFLAIPCDDEHANEKACEDLDTAVGYNKTRPRLNVHTPESVRRLLHGKIGFRYHIPGLGTPRD